MNKRRSIITLENYVGTYSIDILDKDSGSINIKHPCTSSQSAVQYIISEELHPGFKDFEGFKEKSTLPKKNVFDNDFQKKQFTIHKFANIKIGDSEAAINFCKCYGLPISFLLQVVDHESLDSFYLVPDNKNFNNYLHNHDCMLLDDFYLLSSFCRNLLIASNNSANLNPPLKRFAALLSLLLCSPKHNEHVYFTESEPLTPPGHICSAFNQNITLRLSSTFLLLDKFSFYDMYLILCRLRNEYSAAKIDSTFSIKMVELCQKLKALTFYFCSNEAVPVEIAQKDSYGNISFLEHRNSSGDIMISKNIELPLELRIIIDEVAPIIVSDLITEYITKLSISLNFDTKKAEYYTEWKPDSLFTGMLFELSVLCSQDALTRKCANKNCNNLFIPSRSDDNFCCPRCGDATRRRNARAKQQKSAKRITN